MLGSGATTRITGRIGKLRARAAQQQSKGNLGKAQRLTHRADKKQAFVTKKTPVTPTSGGTSSSSTASVPAATV